MKGIAGRFSWRDRQIHGKLIRPDNAPGFDPNPIDGIIGTDSATDYDRNRVRGSRRTDNAPGFVPNPIGGIIGTDSATDYDQNNIRELKRSGLSPDYDQNTTGDWLRGISSLETLFSVNIPRDCSWETVSEGDRLVSSQGEKAV